MYVLLQSAVPCIENDLRMEASHGSANTQSLCHPYFLRDGDGLIDVEVDRKRGCNVFSQPQRYLLPDSHSVKILDHIS